MFWFSIKFPRFISIGNLCFFDKNHWDHITKHYVIEVSLNCNQMNKKINKGVNWDALWQCYHLTGSILITKVYRPLLTAKICGLILFDLLVHIATDFGQLLRLKEQYLSSEVFILSSFKFLKKIDTFSIFCQWHRLNDLGKLPFIWSAFEIIRTGPAL